MAEERALGRCGAHPLHGDGRPAWHIVGAALEVLLGMRFTPEDEAIAPIRAVSCPFCACWVPVDGLGMIETLWMHEYDCSAIAKDYELEAEIAVAV
jgi:hypothetical protein